MIECVPNFSEGRDAEVIGRIAASIDAVDGVRVLHVDSGQATNRTVVTFAGEPDGIEAGAFAGIAAAADLIDMRNHTGTHPRIGAADVVPFVPIGDASMDDCIAIAERVGDRVGNELGIPVYLYAEAARVEQRHSLPAIRRGEYEGLAGKMRRPDFVPDFGPAEFNAKSGATVIGARRFLVAWNVNLNTKDVGVAREMARRLRSSGRRGPGGRRIPGRFRALQGDGWFIEEFDRAQVSFNILDHTVTPVAHLFDACCEEAEALGVAVTGSELIGLVPKDVIVAAGAHFAASETDEAALIEIAVERLGLGELKPFDPERRVLELAYARP